MIYRAVIQQVQNTLHVPAVSTFGGVLPMMDDDDGATYVVQTYLTLLSSEEHVRFSNAAHHIQLWFAVFNPRFNNDDRSILYRAIYESGSGPEKKLAKALQQWYRVCAVGRRTRRRLLTQSLELPHAGMATRASSPPTQLPGGTREASYRKVSRHARYSVSDLRTDYDDDDDALAIQETLTQVIHEWRTAEEDEFVGIRDNLLDKYVLLAPPEEADMIKEIRYLASLRLRFQLPETDDISPSQSASPSASSLRHGDTLLHYLVQTIPNITPAVLQEFFREGLHIHEKGANDRSLLHAAAHGGHVSTVQLLAKEGMDVLATDGYGCNALHDAARAGALPVVQHLVDDMHVNVDVPNKNGRTPLHYAAEFNRQDVVEYFVTHNRTNLNAINGNMRTPLHMAAARGHIDVVHLLLNAGAAILPNMAGDTIFHDAAKFNHVDLLESFTKQGGYARFAVAKNNQGRTPLHVAAANSAVEAYVLLNGNPWSGRHAGLMKDDFGLYPLNLLLESDAIPLENGLNLAKYPPRNNHTDLAHEREPIWNDDMFASLLRESPEYAWAFLDGFKVAVSWSCGRTEWSFPKLGDMYGDVYAVERSALASIVEAYNRGDKEKRSYCITCLSHAVMTRIMHLKWKLFGSIFLLFVTTVCVSLSNVQVEFTKPRYCLLVLMWTWLFVFTSGAIYVSLRYSHMKRNLQNLSFLNPATKPYKQPPQGATSSRKSLRARVVSFLLPEKFLRRSSSLAYSFVRSNSTFRQVTPRTNANTLANGGLTKPSTKRLVLKDSVVAFFLGTVLATVGLIVGSVVALFVFASIGDSTASAATKFFHFNLVIRWILAVEFLVVEGLVCHGSPKRYLRVKWNSVKAAVLMCIVLFETPLDLGWVALDKVVEAQAILYAVTSLLLWVNFLQVLRVNESTGPMITMVLNMVPDVANFLMMYGVFQMGLTCAYFALLKGGKGFESFGDTFLTTYLIIFGQLNLDVVLGNEYPRQLFISVFIMLHYLVVAIVLLNAFVAVLSMTAENVLERVNDQVVFNHAESILRAEIMMPHWLRTRVRRQAKGKKTKVKGLLAFAKTVHIKDDENEAEDTTDDTVRKIERALEKCLDDVRDLTNHVRNMQKHMDSRMTENADKMQGALDAIVLMLRTTHEQKNPTTPKLGDGGGGGGGVPHHHHRSMALAPTVKLLLAYENSDLSANAICVREGIPRSTWQTWLKKKDEYLNTRRHKEDPTLGGQGRPESMQFGAELLAFMKAVRKDNRRLTTAHMVRWIQKHQQEWLESYYLATKGGHVALLGQCQRFAHRHGFAQQCVPCSEVEAPVNSCGVVANTIGRSAINDGSLS
ncbi:hypothetical protein DYB36_000359 [Aphanomyces astaci]|uniref:Ion transport domain-containing protein n=1 Tax=Aphanomyces astaci TaxID=112090 RepID=A0A397ALY3_APHAT|nr:hypothetical protein DYB36_000359 [Aphanomyces astaci]